MRGVAHDSQERKKQCAIVVVVALVSVAGLAGVVACVFAGGVSVVLAAVGWPSVGECKVKRHKHSLSHYRLFTGDMGELLPVGCVEVLPGDSFQHRASCLIRLSPLVAPVMHPVDVRLHHWFVPNRLVWDGWEDFITGEVDEVTEPVPTVTSVTTEGGLLDYLGVPLVAGIEVNAMPVRAYNMIYNEFYRDQDLITEAGEDDLTVRKISWQKDYFAGARPWAQKGDAVSVPIGDEAPIRGLGRVDGGGATDLSSQTMREYDARDTSYAAGWSSATSAIGLQQDPDNTSYPLVYADLASASGVNINELRRAFALQRYAEARARYGSRYTEYLRYLGVRSSDARLQRPEYLGGGKQTIAFSEILQTTPQASPSTSDFGVGSLYGHGIAAMRTKRYRRFFEEHGYVITLMSVRPKTMYANALHRKWIKTTKEDWYQKELETIGQQEVYDGEIFAQTSPTANVFGYADRYREYREEPSTVGAEYRSTFDYWHLARDLASSPTLNQSFVECVPSKRIHAVQTNDVLWCMVNHSLQARRLVNRSAYARIL